MYVESSVYNVLNRCCLRALLSNVRVSIVRCYVSLGSICWQGYALQRQYRSLALSMFLVELTSPETWC
jgi:hypothetical protein